MPLQENDISWQLLRRIVSDWTGTAAELTEVKPLSGGCINTTIELTLKDGRRAVLKISPHRVDRSYEYEAHQLLFLRKLGLPVPEIYAVKMGTLDAPHSYLLLEFVDGVDLHEAQRQCNPEQFDDLQAHLADLVSTLHDQTATHYTRLSGNGSPQFQQWSEFYRDVYEPIWNEVLKSAVVPTKLRKQITRIHDRLDRLISHPDVPRLVHSDIWATNLLARPDDSGRWRICAILDPNCKYAHAEAEIAYMELFHTITPAFLKAYQARHKLNGDYHRVRRQVYQLYELINHVNLFGEEYLKPLTAAVEKMTPVV